MTRSLLLLSLLVVGCGVPSLDGRTPTPIVRDDTVWTALAKRIDSGRIGDTDLLILIVDDLRESDAITDADRSKFDAAFPGIKQKRRDTTPADASILRELK